MSKMDTKDWLTVDYDFENDDIRVTGLTNEGFMALVEIIERVNEGQDIELICVDMDLDPVAFRIFYASCNLLGAVDAVEKALNEME